MRSPLAGAAACYVAAEQVRKAWVGAASIRPGGIMARATFSSGVRSTVRKSIWLYLWVPVLVVASFLPVAGRSGGPASAAIPADFFTKRRHCTPEFIDALPPSAFFSGTGAQLQTRVNTLPTGSTLVIGQPSNGAPEYEVTVEMAITGKQNVTICSDPRLARPVIKQLNNVWRIFTIGNSTDITIEGLEIKSIYDEAHDRVSGVQAIEGAARVHIWDMWVHDVPACGICSARSNGYNDFRYNRIWKTSAFSRYQQSGISLFNNRNAPNSPTPNVDPQTGYSDYLIGNMVWGSQVELGRTTDGNCIIIDNNNGVQKVPAFRGRTLIANNVCVANGGRGIHMLKSDNIDVVHNTLYHDLRGAQKRGGGLDQHQGEISVYYSSNLRIVKNLSIALAYGNVYDTGATGANVQLSHNVFHGPTSRHPSTGFDTIEVDPITTPNKADPPDGNWQPDKVLDIIQKPADYRGIMLVPTVDFAGNPRNTANPAAGALEPA